MLDILHFMAAYKPICQVHATGIPELEIIQINFVFAFRIFGRTGNGSNLSFSLPFTMMRRHWLVLCD